MGFLFGGPKFDYRQLPGSQGVLDRIYGFDPTQYMGMVGLGKAGKLYGGLLDALKSGSLDGNKLYSAAVLNPIKSSFAAQARVAERSAAPFMDMNLKRAQDMEYQRKLSQDEANAISQGTAGLIDSATSGYQNALANKRATGLGLASLGLEKEGMGANFFLNSFKGPTGYSGGLMGALGGLGGALAAGHFGAALGKRLFGG
ncbi:MAG: hypothetical protein AB1489_12065 [Acidobacteriota bacterium]